MNATSAIPGADPPASDPRRAVRGEAGGTHPRPSFVRLARIGFVLAGIVFTALLCKAVFLHAHSEILPERMWEDLQRPACRIFFYQWSALGCFAAAWALLGVDFLRRNAGRRRRAAAAGVAVSALFALASLGLACRSLGELNAASRVFETLDGDAYPGVVGLLDFRYHGSTPVDGPAFEARIEFNAGNAENFTKQSRPAASGDETEALRAAHEAFPAFRPNPSGTVLSIRPDSAWEGWIVPGESPVQCVVLAWKRTTP